MTERDAYQAGVPCWVDVLAPDPTRRWRSTERCSAGSSTARARASTSWPQLRGRDVAGVGAQPAGVPTGWNTYVSVESAEQAAEARRRRGAGPDPPFDALPAGRVAVLADPTGAAICVWEPRELAGRAPRQRGERVGDERAPHRRARTCRGVLQGRVRLGERAVRPPGMALFRLPGYVGGVPGQPVPLDVVAVMAPATVSRTGKSASGSPTPTRPRQRRRSWAGAWLCRRQTPAGCARRSWPTPTARSSPWSPRRPDGPTDGLFQARPRSSRAAGAPRSAAGSAGCPRTGRGS